MGKISEYSVKKPITVLMTVLIVIILGFVSLTRLKTELFPSMNLPYTIVSTQYIGASHEEVELAVTKPLEGQLATISNIKNIQSISQEHSSLIFLEFNESTNMDSAMIEMREKLDMLKNYLPDGVSHPMIIKASLDMLPIMNFSVSFEGQTISDSTRIVENQILPRIERIAGVASIDVQGTSTDEIQIELNPVEMVALSQAIALENSARTAFNESLTDEQAFMKQSLYPSADELVQNVIKGQNMSMPVGSVTDDGTDYIVRVGDAIEDIEELKELTIFKTYTLEDIATVEFVSVDSNSYSKMNGEHAITFNIQKQNSYATTEVVAAIHEEIEKIKTDFPGIEVVVLLDQAEYINQSINSVTMNLIIGGILAVLILFLFLRQIKPTVIIALAIPISVMAAFVLIYFSGITLNIISMGGLALGIGMLVDNSIVVIENIYRLREEGYGRIESAVKGASQVSGAIVASTLTTVSVFLPVVFMQGMTAQIFKEMALTITYSLGASLVIALTVVPTLSSKMMPEAKEEKKLTLEPIKNAYKKVLKLALNYKLTTLLATLVLLVGSAFLSYRVGTEFFPSGAANQLTVSVTLPEGTNFEDATVAVDAVVEEIMLVDGIDFVGANIGAGGPMGLLNGGSSQGTIYVILEEDTKRSLKEVGDDIREVTGHFTYEIEVDEAGMDMTGLGGSGVSILVKGQDLEQLEIISKDIASLVAGVRGTTEIDDGISKTSPEIKVTVNKEAAAAKGLTVAQVLQTVAYYLQDEKAITQLTVSGKEYDIKIKQTTTELGKADIEGIMLMSLDGPVYLRDIADVDPNHMGFGTINRVNQSRFINVTASILEGYNVGQVGQKITKAIEGYQVPDGYQIEIQGEQEQITSAMTDLALAVALAIVLIYMIMAAQFQSLLYPFIVMFTIPLAFTGGFLGLFITQTPISVVAAIGLIILTGIIVNNGIVLVDYINQLKAEGKSTYDAVIEAGMTRLRPILMTALTTILALSTMALGIGEGAEMLQPMAITTIGGLVYATLLTLIVVPVIYTGLDHLKMRLKRKSSTVTD